MYTVYFWKHIFTGILKGIHVLVKIDFPNEKSASDYMLWLNSSHEHSDVLTGSKWVIDGEVELIKQ